MTCNCKYTKSATVLTVLAAAGGALYYFMNKKKEEPIVKGSQNVELVKPQKTPEGSVGQEFYMPHFMIKNLKITPSDSGIEARVDYKIDEVLYNYLMHNTPHYRFRFTLPDELKPKFEGNGTQKMLGELVYGTGDKRDYSVTFKFKKNDDVDARLMKEINETTGIYKMDIVDEQLKVLNSYDNVYGAANLMR